MKKIKSSFVLNKNCKRLTEKEMVAIKGGGTFAVGCVCQCVDAVGQWESSGSGCKVLNTPFPSPYCGGNGKAICYSKNGSIIIEQP